MSQSKRSKPYALRTKPSNSTITNKPHTFTIMPTSPTPLWRLPRRTTTLHLLFALLTIILTAVSLCSAAPAPAVLHLGSPTLKGPNTAILIWPDEIEDNALAEQNGDFIYKKATAAEKQEQKSSSSIFFWPSSQGGSHHNHHHRSSRNTAHHLSYSVAILLTTYLLNVYWHVRI